MDRLSTQTVFCHSGSTYAERPVALVWEGERLEIKSVAGQYNSPDGFHFRVQTFDGRFFGLYYDNFSDEWRIDPDQ